MLSVFSYFAYILHFITIVVVLFRQQFKVDCVNVSGLANGNVYPLAGWGQVRGTGGRCKNLINSYVFLV